jgi:hypothetical protein
MKRFQVVIVALVLLLNLVIAKPSWADREKPPYFENSDYIEVTQTLTNLLTTKNAPPEGTNPEDIQKQISDLQFQKYTLETGINWGQCRNETGKTLGVYGEKKKKSGTSYDNALYFLPTGQTTEDKWDCDGIYVPSDVKISGLDTAGVPAVIKIVDGTQLVAKTNPETGEVELNIPPAKVFKAGEVNWFIPDVAQAAIDTRVPNAPTNEND